MELGFPTWVGVVCEDLDSQRRFYEEVLGMAPVRDGDGFVAYELKPGGEFVAHVVGNVSDGDGGHACSMLLLTALCKHHGSKGLTGLFDMAI